MYRGCNYNHLMNVHKDMRGPNWCNELCKHLEYALELNFYLDGEKFCWFYKLSVAAARSCMLASLRFHNHKH